MELSLSLQTLRFSSEFYVLLLAATLLFLWRQERRSHFFVRLLGLMVFGTVVMLLLRELISSPNLKNLLIYSSAMGTMSVIAYTCFEISWSEAIFCAVAGYSAQFAESACSELCTRLFSIQGFSHELSQFLIAVSVYTLIYRAFGRNLKRGQNFDISKWFLLALVIGAVLIEIVICFNLRLEWNAANDPNHIVWDSLLLFIGTWAILTIQFTLLVQRNLENELKVIYQMWRKEQDQFRISQETIDQINRKCHDMRHQIHSIGTSANVSPAALKEMESSINIYDSLYNTGSQALDIILTEKSLYCQKNNIIISCIADGANLRFLSDSDIYSLFGNLLDNAIHAVQDLEIDKRIIGLSVKRCGELLSINSHNCYTGQIIMRNGLPQTSSGDPANHGFGTKSMAAIAAKYGGTISFQAKNGIFNLNLLFPISQDISEQRREISL